MLNRAVSGGIAPPGRRRRCLEEDRRTKKLDRMFFPSFFSSQSLSGHSRLARSTVKRKKIRREREVRRIGVVKRKKRMKRKEGPFLRLHVDILRLRENPGEEKVKKTYVRNQEKKISNQLPIRLILRLIN